MLITGPDYKPLSLDVEHVGMFTIVEFGMLVNHGLMVRLRLIMMLRLIMIMQLGLIMMVKLN